MTEEEKLEKRRAYQRQYYKDYRRGRRAEAYICASAQTEKKWDIRRRATKLLTYTIFFAICLTLCAGCSSESKTLYESSSVSVVKEGDRIAVQDQIAEREYQYRIVRVRRSDSVSVPQKETETDTIKIAVLSPAGIWVHDKTAGRIFTYQRNIVQKKG